MKLITEICTGISIYACRDACMPCPSQLPISPQGGECLMPSYSGSSAVQHLANTAMFSVQYIQP